MPLHFHNTRTCSLRIEEIFDELLKKADTQVQTLKGMKAEILDIN